MIPTSGWVLGIDVGYSAKRPTTGLCRLSWTEHEVTWKCCKARATDDGRKRAIAALAGDAADPKVMAVAIDGPLRPGLRVDRTYRACEAVLSRGVLQRRGKPGQTNSPVGYRLHDEATRLAQLTLDVCDVGEASWSPRIHDRAVVEAFPNLFLAVLCDEDALPAKPSTRRRWTDELFPRVRQACRRLLAEWLPGRGIRGDLDLKDHEAIAGLVCAMTALTAVAGDGVLVGSPADGCILLPPRRAWGRASHEPGDWAASVLKENVAGVRQDPRFGDACILDLAIRQPPR